MTSTATTVDRRRVLAGVFLVLFGMLWLAANLLDAIGLDMLGGSLPWVVLLALGLALAFSAMINRDRGQASGAAVLTGLGTILMWQSATGRWDSWAWIWALIPGFAGLGILYGDLVTGTIGARTGEALRLLTVSAVLALVFGGFFGAFGIFGNFWPVLIVLAGVILLLRRT